MPVTAPGRPKRSHQAPMAVALLFGRMADRPHGARSILS